MSSREQAKNSSLESQKAELIKLGVPEENIYLEIGSATDVIENLPIFFKLINQILKEGDLLIVTKLDRCSRNTLSFLQLKNQLAEKGVDFWVLDLPKDYLENSPSSRFKTEKTPENSQAFKEEIKNLVLNGERIEGTYRKAEPDGYPASHFYDPTTGKNAIFKKQTKEFVSAWKLTKGQIEDLLTNGNVGDY